uniref:Chemokine interleukin-8-like domain-containing protein n=1 Tax=Oryzias latipes TaxID=8090 RepID=A0A3P9H4U1_ORYLA
QLEGFIVYILLPLVCYFSASPASIQKKQNPQVIQFKRMSLKGKRLEFPPRPYCSKLEIIITLKNNVKVCLDPTHKFAKAVLESTKVERQAEVRTMGSTTTTTAATAVPTWS